MFFKTHYFLGTWTASNVTVLALFEQFNNAELISVLLLSFFNVGIVQFYHIAEIDFFLATPS